MIAAGVACMRPMTTFDSSPTDRAKRSIASGSLCFGMPLRFFEDCD